RSACDDSDAKDSRDNLRELGADPKPIRPRPQLQGGALGVESAAAFDSYVQWKGKELGLGLADIPEAPPGRGAGGGGGAGGAGAGGGGTPGGGATGGPPPNPGNPTGMAAVTRWT